MQIITYNAVEINPMQFESISDVQMTKKNTATQKSLSRRSAALGAIALRNVRTGTVPCLQQSGQVVFAGLSAGVVGAIGSGAASLFGMMFTNLRGNQLGYPLAKAAMEG